jgi:3-hydroxyacyl-[acyl-carrier-protein] dehydratase
MDGPLDKLGMDRCVPPMKFNLLDKIEEISDTRIVAVKHVSLAEEYLADHFPSFPVLPGVMMLEALTQAAAWIMHARSGFAKSFAVLKEARNVKYGNFVAPGNFLRVEVEYLKQTEAGASFKASGTVNGGATAVTARIEIAYFNLGDKQPQLAELDARLIEHHRRRWGLIAPRQVSTVALAN